MTHQEENSILDVLLKELTLSDPDGLRNTMRILLNAAMRSQQDSAIKADHYERSEEREAYRNGYKDKTISTRLGKITVQVPQVRGGLSFYPSCLEKGIRSERSLKLAMAEMYVKGVATRRVSSIVEELCGTEVSSSQVSAEDQRTG
jgi:putative transposase